MRISIAQMLYEDIIADQKVTKASFGKYIKALEEALSSDECPFLYINDYLTALQLERIDGGNKMDHMRHYEFAAIRWFKTSLLTRQKAIKNVLARLETMK